MGKRKSDRQISKSEIKLSGQHHYDGYEKKPSRINPIWLQDNYGVVKEGKK